jgi:hypothetical protein
MGAADQPGTPVKRPGKSVVLAVVAVFSALIAVGTVISIPLPPPLYELTWSPAIYFTLAVLVDSWTAFDATAIGGFLGEAFNVAFKGGGSPIYPFGIVWARGPEVFIIAWAKNKSPRALALAMAGATVFETLAFFFPDWAFYYYGLFQYGTPTGIYTAFTYAVSDFGTLLDLLYIPVAFILIRQARPAFKRLGFG